MNVYIINAYVITKRVNISKKMYICSLYDVFKVYIYMLSMQGFFFIENNQAI